MSESATTAQLWPDFVEQDDTRADALRDFRRYLTDCGVEGGILSQSHAARVVGVSSSAVSSAIAQGRLERFDYPEMGMTGVSAIQVKAYARERKQGPTGGGNPKGIAGR